jgi:hypothetical protein
LWDKGAFSFGIALYDVNECVLRRVALKPSSSEPSILLGEAAPGQR